MSDSLAVIVKGLINVQILGSGHAEHRTHALSFQTLQQQISAGQSRRLSTPRHGVARFIPHAVKFGTFHTSPKRKRGNRLRPSLALRASVNPGHSYYRCVSERRGKVLGARQKGSAIERLLE